MRFLTVFVAVTVPTLVAACGGGVITGTEGEPPVEARGTRLRTFYSGVQLDGSQCMPQALNRECRVLVVSTRCVGEEGLRDAEPSDQEELGEIATIGPGQRVCELAQMSPGLCNARSSLAWCYVAGDCAARPASGPSCAHSLCPGMGMGPTLASLGAAYLACDRQ